MVALHQDRIAHAARFADGIGEGYRHYPKSIKAREPVTSPDVRLKWYDIGFAEFPFDQRLHDEARDFLAHEIDARSFESSGKAGFVVLHDCGEIVFLLVTTWCGSNELWESVYIKRPDLEGTFRPQRVPGDHRPTFCVWEMGVVAHESLAWSRYLSSERGPNDFITWFDDQFTGAIQ